MIAGAVAVMDVTTLAREHVSWADEILSTEEALAGLEDSRTAIVTASDAVRSQIAHHLGPDGRNARAGERFSQRGQVTAVDAYGDDSELGFDQLLTERTRLNREQERIAHELRGLAAYLERCRLEFAQATAALGRALSRELPALDNSTGNEDHRTMSVPEPDARWTRLHRPERRTYAPIATAELRLYGPYHARLTVAALEALGSPPAVALELSEGVYSIVGARLGEPDALPILSHQRLSTGILAPAVKGGEFPIAIPLMPADGETGRLIFGRPVSQPRSRRPRSEEASR